MTIAMAYSKASLCVEYQDPSALDAGLVAKGNWETQACIGPGVAL